jgi:hypothetical protein
VVNSLDAKLIGAVALVWGIFALACWSLGMFESAATWGAGACIFLLLAVAMALAHRRAVDTAPAAAAELKENQHLDVILIAAVAVVWSIFALAYGALGMPISAATWGVGAWLFIAMTAGLMIAGRRRRHIDGVPAAKTQGDEEPRNQDHDQHHRIV